MLTEVRERPRVQKMRLKVEMPEGQRLTITMFFPGYVYSTKLKMCRRSDGCLTSVSQSDSVYDTAAGTYNPHL